MALRIGRLYKTREGAAKRARFERAHQDHLIRRYDYLVVPSPDGRGYYVHRVPQKQEIQE